MRVLLTVCFLWLIVNIGSGQNRWRKEKIRLPYPVCYASGESHPSYIGLPQAYYQRLKSASLKTANIEVTYIGFTPQAQQAFQQAVDIWKNLVYSPVPIRVRASWKSLSKGVLGSCGPTGFYKNFDASQQWDTYYPVALAEKMMGQEVNSPEQYDLDAEFNKDFSNWYLGTDGKTPVNQYDFVSVVLHELTHGLGFTGLFYSESGKGEYGYGSDPYPAIYDRHVINKSSDFLLNRSLFPNPSIALHQALTSGWLQFYTSKSAATFPRLYAPVGWDDGSSIYHLDDATYGVGNPNSLMTPFTGMGEAIHHPGPEGLKMIYEMGWKSITIKHQPLKDIEQVLSPIDFKAVIESDDGLDVSKLYLVYSTNRFSKTDSILLGAGTTAGDYSVLLSQFKSGEVDYFFSATDVAGRRFVYPSNAPKRYLSFKIGTDRTLPVIEHQPLKYMLSSLPTAQVEAKVTDNLGVESVYLEYIVSGGTLKQLPMQNTGDDTYSATLTLPPGSVKGGEKVSYRIVGVDASQQKNTVKNPLSGYNTFTVEEIRKPVESYQNNFNALTSDFIGTDFYMSTPAGFDSRAMNSAHPYPSPDSDNVDFNFITILRTPIILKAGGKMSYDEIVMVEPGDSGATFWDEEFWDYVIVEGSKDGGNSWYPLLDGYDSNSQPSWLDKYNSSMTDNNSSAIPGKDLYINHEFEMLANGNFTAGDTILVRFRLFSDPYSHGWGWIIDNLKIQDGTTDSYPSLLSSGEVMLYPNPASGSLNINIQSKTSIGNLVVKAYNVSGAAVYSTRFAARSKGFISAIDVSNFTPGLYLFVLEAETGQKITRKILIQ